MRALYVVVSTLVFLALILLGAFWLPDVGSTAGWEFWLDTLAIFLLTVPAIALGAFVQWWPLEPWRASGRRYLLRMTLLLAALQVAGAVLVVVLAADGDGPLWRAAVYVAAVAALSVLHFFFARAVRRRDELRPPVPSATWDRAIVRRKARTVALWFVGALVAAVALDLGLTAFLRSMTDEEPDPSSILQLALVALSLAFITGALACLVVTWPLIQQVREVKGRYFADFRTITRVVLKGKRDELSAEAEHRAARYAGIMVTLFPFQLTQVSLLYAAILCQQVGQALGGLTELRGFSLGIAIALVVTYAVMLPVLLVRWRRARRYAEDHRDVLAPVS